MGLGDKFKDLAKQAQDAVAEHKDQIHDAVDAVSVAADRKTHGRHTDKIAKMGQRAGSAIDRLGDGAAPDGDSAARSGAPEAPGAGEAEA